MMGLLVAVMWHLGMNHMPFPRVDPIVPPPSQPCNTGHDGVGTSRTRPEDTDDGDDNDADDKETETESESSEE